MAKKVGILTFHYAINYGAVLQAYALSQVCKELGYEVQIINYYTQHHEKANSIFNDRSRGIIKMIVYSLLVLPHYLQLRRKRNRFRQFQKDMLPLSERYDSAFDLFNNLPEADVYITGSDQVFNPVSNENVKVYYLDFKKINGSKKVAYAPSFGLSTFDDSLKDKVGCLLKDFDHISCRENDGAVFISSVTGTEVKSVLDPVFLLGTKDWETIEASSKEYCRHRDNYILVYDLNGRDNLISIAKKLKGRVDLPIVCLTTKKYCVSRYHVDETILDAGPKEFLSLIRHAKYIVTDSFHGVAFSVIFEKDFLAYNALPKASQRIKSLLETLSLKERLLEHSNVDIDSIWEAIRHKEDYRLGLNELVISSKTYLKDSLK